MNRKQITANQIHMLHVLYREILGRDADDTGIGAYAPLLPERAQEIKQTLYASQEYKQLQAKKNNKESKNNSENMDSMSGDRKTYISAQNTDLIDHSPYKTMIESALTVLANIAHSKIELSTMKLALLDKVYKHHRLTFFPHKEYFFNTNNFIESLKDISNFKYYAMFINLSLFYKALTGTMVHTCGTQRRIKSLLQKMNTLTTFEDFFQVTHVELLNYLSIRINGSVLKVSELNKLKDKIIVDGDSSFIINYLQDKDKEVRTKEKETIESNISSLKKKPKVLLHIAYLENQEEYLLQKMLEHAYNVQKLNPLLDVEIYFENDRIGKEKGDYTPWSRVKRIRNLMLDRTENWDDLDYIYVIDSDIVWYPYDFVSRAVGLNANGITAPLALIENSNVFYDWCGYQKKDHTSIRSQYKQFILNKSCSQRNFALAPPYVYDDKRLVELDCVGCTYVVPASVFKGTYEGQHKQELLEVFNFAGVKKHNIAEGKVRYEDHPTFTDHYTVCTALRSQGGKVLLDRGSTAYHADLPIYGEEWH